MSVGASLREIRMRAALSTAQLAAKTRIPESVIIDLEQDNFGSSLGVAYVRGHIRAIARTCNVDAEEILLKLESQTIPLNKSIRDLLNDMSATPTEKVKKPVSWRSLAGVTVGVLAFALVGAAIFASTQSSTDSIAKEEVATQVETGPVAKKSDGVEVMLRGVNGLSWVAINDSSGATQFSGRIREGEERTFTDDQLLYLVIGNAGAIELKVNGENLGLSGAVGEVVRLEFGPQAIAGQG
jgi:cytoskeleton protein RodZ